MAGSTLAYFLYKRNSKLKIAVLYSSQREPCSLHSTGIISTFGVKRGSSLRGDMICQSVDKAENFFIEKNPQGVKKVSHWYAHSNKESHCYLVTPHLYLDWLERESKCEYWDECVEEVEESRVIVASGKVFEGKVIILASGAYIKKENKFFPVHPYIAGSSIVKGSYGFFESIDWKKSSFVFSIGKTNLIYRHEDKKILIGGTTDREDGIKPNSEAVENCYNILLEFFDLPPLDTINLGVGLRHRGVKRMPFWGELANNVYGILGLYKNGWSFSFLAAEEILQQLARKDALG